MIEDESPGVYKNGRRCLVRWASELLVSGSSSWGASANPNLSPAGCWPAPCRRCCVCCPSSWCPCGGVCSHGAGGRCAPGTARSWWEKRPGAGCVRGWELVYGTRREEFPGCCLAGRSTGWCGLRSAHERNCKSHIFAALVINSEIIGTCSSAPSTPVA